MVARLAGGLAGQFPDEETYQRWFIHLIGIRGDPARARNSSMGQTGRAGSIILTPARPAFTVNPSRKTCQSWAICWKTWGTRELSVLDPFAGGGSIPFEALATASTIANDLNPVAAVILKATLDTRHVRPRAGRGHPQVGTAGRLGSNRSWNPTSHAAGREHLRLPVGAHGSLPNHRQTGAASPNWWLRTGGEPVAVRLIAEEGMASRASRS